MFKRLHFWLNFARNLTNGGLKPPYSFTSLSVRTTECSYKLTTIFIVLAPAIPCNLTQIRPVEYIWYITNSQIKLLLINTTNLLETILLSFWQVCDCSQDVLTVFSSVLFGSCNSELAV